MGNPLDWLDSLPPDALAAVMAEAQAELDRHKLADYVPYEKQLLFHKLGLDHRERLLGAGNQNGKTYSAGAEWAIHLTGQYPEWWPGRRFEGPGVFWASSDTGETTRDNPQRSLLGSVGEIGTGWIPADCLGDYGMASGIADLFDFIRVKHHDQNGQFDGWSLLRFKYYAQGRRKWQGPPVRGVWFDEEPPEDIYDEGLARTIATRGMAALSFTPLLGQTQVVKRFLGKDATKDRANVRMTIYDAKHISPEEREVIIASFPAHQRKARSEGIPTLGSGLIFPVEESSIMVKPFQIEKHWARLVGGDFGWNHPAAWVWLAHDRDNDIVYITDAYRAKETLIPVQASAIKGRGAWIPVAWPHDGYQVRDAMHGEQLAEQYRKEGVNMRPEHAKFAETPVVGERKESLISTEAGIQEMLTRMMTGRLKVFSHLEEWFEEFRLYHRKEGLIVKLDDDLMSATRIGVMDLRHAITEPKRAGHIDHNRRSDGMY